MASRALMSAPLEPARPDPVRAPTDAHPRWRLVLFDRRWPWRATRGEVMRDAIAARLGSHDRDDKAVYLSAGVFVQRDPPSRPWGSVRPARGVR